MMATLKRMKITSLNEYIVCALCSGYYIEATTISECLHTFCKMCIVNYLQSNIYCPVCEVLIHKTKPWEYLREDKTLQDIVYKLVPELFHSEMARRTRFYQEHPEAGGDRTEQSLKERRHFFHVDDQISLSLEFLPPAHAHAHALGLRPLRAPSLTSSQTSKVPAEGEDTKVEVKVPLRRYLSCPAAVPIRLLEKFIREKYRLTSEYRVDIVHGGDCLSPELTLLDVVYMYKWTEVEPLNLQYTVIAPPLPYRKRPRSVLGKSKLKPLQFESPPTKKIKTEDKKVSSNEMDVSDSEKETLKKNNATSDVDKECSLSKKTPSADSKEVLNTSRDDGESEMVIDETPVDAEAMEVDETKKMLNGKSSTSNGNIGSLSAKEPSKSTNSSIESLKALVNSSSYPPSKGNAISNHTMLTTSSTSSPMTSVSQNCSLVTSLQNPISSYGSSVTSYQAMSVNNSVSQASFLHPSTLEQLIQSSEAATSSNNSILTTVDTSILSSPMIYQHHKAPICTVPKPIVQQAKPTPQPIAVQPKPSQSIAVQPKSSQPIAVQSKPKPIAVQPKPLHANSTQPQTVVSQHKAQPIAKKITPNKTPPSPQQIKPKESPISSKSTLLPKPPISSVVESPAISLSPVVGTTSVSLSSSLNTLPSPSPSLLTPKHIQSSPSVRASLSPMQPALTQQPSRLVSNSYRATLSANRVNGVATRPMIDPSKPRLGRPPNSARILASRMGMHPIQPRGVPRNPYNQAKVVAPKMAGRGRPKAPNNVDAKIPLSTLGMTKPLPSQSVLSMPVTGSSIGQNNVINATKTSPSIIPLTNGGPKNVNNKETTQPPAKNETPKLTVAPVSKSEEVRISVSKTETSIPMNVSFPNKVSVSTSLKSPKPTVTAPSVSKSSPMQLHMNTTQSSIKPSKSPGRAKNTASNASSIHDIAQSLANKKLQQQTQEFPSMLPSGLGLPMPLTSPFNVYAHMLMQQAAAAQYQNLYPALAQSRLMEPEPSKTDTQPMDLSPTNKGAPASVLSSNSKPKIAKPFPNSKISSKPTTPQNVKVKTKSTKGPNVSKASKSNFAPPTSEVTITKLSGASSDTPTSSASITPVLVTKPSSTNTVSITKRPSVSSANNNSVKFSSTRSPSNASVRQIPNPSLLSHQSEVRKNTTVKPLNVPQPTLNNNNNNNNTKKMLQVDS